jgi:hypothetical protein
MASMASRIMVTFIWRGNREQERDKGGQERGTSRGSHQGGSKGEGTAAAEQTRVSCKPEKNRL